MLNHTALVDDEQCWQAAIVPGYLTILVAGNKVQSLFAAVDGLVYKRSLNLIQILTIEVRI